MLKELVKKCRTYRRFYQEVPISMEELTDLVDTARLTASASNLQPLRYKLVNEPELCAQIFPHLRWAGALKDWDGPEEGGLPPTSSSPETRLFPKTASMMWALPPRPSCWLPWRKDTEAA